MEPGSGSLDPSSSSGESQGESTDCAWEREEGHNSRIYSSSRASLIGVTLPEGPHGMGWQQQQEKEVPSTHQSPARRPSQRLRNKPHPCGTVPSQELSWPAHGQPGQATHCWKEQGAGWPPPCCSLKCFPVPAFGRGCPAPSTQQAAPRLQDAGSARSA